MSTPRAVLRLTDVEKTYPGVRALKRVSFEVLAGEVHALVGENGAGKSTLMAVAAGATVPDSGTVEIDGTVMDSPTPSAAAALGLAVVYQHTSVLDDLTVAENMVFSLPPREAAVARRRRAAGPPRSCARSTSSSTRRCASASSASPSATCWRSRRRSCASRRCSCSTSRPSR